jgi:hypothetical protein
MLALEVCELCVRVSTRRPQQLPPVPLGGARAPPYKLKSGNEG